MRKFLLITIFLSSHFISAAQGNLDINIGKAKTELKNNALRLGVNYAADVFKGFSDHQANGDNHFILLMPEFSTEEGSEDAFSSIVAKITGFSAIFKKTKIDEIEIPDLQKTFHVFPFSLGVETNGEFSFSNMIFEAGYFPWYYQPTNKLPGILKHTKTGFFLQGGYKFLMDTSNAKNTGGAKDESSEDLETGIFRAKFVFEMDTKNLMRIKEGLGIVLNGGLNFWYDIANSKTYHSLKGKARFYINKNYYFDFAYEKGSGAPNFNKGDCKLPHFSVHSKLEFSSF